jgi:hypothetical protein
LRPKQIGRIVGNNAFYLGIHGRRGRASGTFASPDAGDEPRKAAAGRGAFCVMPVSPNQAIVMRFMAMRAMATIPYSDICYI